ncbi:MAG: amidase [Rhizobiales bacterium]|nr:amidase [Hyphomicrobiales bacterium]
MPIANDTVHAFVDLPDVAVPNAPDGPLHGVTLAVKDIYDVAGYVTGCGNVETMAEAAPATTCAPCVQALLDAGARFVGKTHTAEFAFSLDGRNTRLGTPENPAAPGRVPGGSSSGSAAAVAAGLADVALGSDTGGSVRAPASFCGLVGLRPTHGRIDIAGTMPLAPSLDTVGWFTRDIGLYERVGAVLLGADRDGPPLGRLLSAADAFAALGTAGEAEALAPALGKARAAAAAVGTVTVAAEGLDAWVPVFRVTQGFEAWRAHGPFITRRQPALMPAVRERFLAASRVTEDEYRAAAATRERIRAHVTALLGDDGMLLMPTLPTIAPRLDDSEETFEAFRARALSILCIAGLAGLPQISLPLATLKGCPLGLSLVGPPGRDRALIAFAARVMAG